MDRQSQIRERLITLACALAAALLFAGLFLRGDEGAQRQRDTPRPTTAERRGNGYYVARHWLAEEGVRTMTLRERFGTLEHRSGLAPSGNLLLVSLPIVVSFKGEELRALERWVRAGNSLLVLAALADDPDWAFTAGGVAFSDLTALSGLEFETHTQRDVSAAAADVGARTAVAAKAFAAPRRNTLIPNRPLAYVRAVREAVALSDYPWQGWHVKVPFNGFILSVAHDSSSGEGVLWTRPLGAGTVIVSGFASLFTNRALPLADNARLLASLVAATVKPGGTVIFDDVHQGLGVVYDPVRFYRDPRLFWTFATCGAVWLLWVLGGTALRVTHARLVAPREAELVRASGGFLSCALRPDAAARRLFEHFWESLPPSAGATSAEACWQLLERHPAVSRQDLRQLKQWYARARAARRVPLGRLHNLMLRMRSQLRSLPA